MAEGPQADWSRPSALRGWPALRTASSGGWKERLSAQAQGPVRVGSNPFSTNYHGVTLDSFFLSGSSL